MVVRRLPLLPPVASPRAISQAPPYRSMVPPRIYVAREASQGSGLGRLAWRLGQATIPGEPDYCTNGQERCKAGLRQLCGELASPHCPVGGWEGPGCPVPWVRTAWYDIGQCPTPTAPPGGAPPPPVTPWYQDRTTLTWIAVAGGALVLGMFLSQRGGG